MKSKLILSMVIILVAIAASLGATLAWFTAESEPIVNSFQAGTVTIEADEVFVMNSEKMLNVNPGDCFVKCFEIENTGTKSIQLMMEEFSVSYDIAGVTDALYPGGPLFIAPLPTKDGDNWVSDWVMEQTADGFNFYYTGGSIPGTYAVGLGEADDSERFIRLCVVVVFDGKEMDNKYQGAEFTLTGKFQAVQTTNNAPSEAWGVDWVNWNATDGWFNMSYEDALAFGTNNTYKDYFVINQDFISCLDEPVNGGGGSSSGETAFAGGIKIPNTQGISWLRYFAHSVDGSLNTSQIIYAGNDDEQIGVVVFSENDGKTTFNITLNGWQLKAGTETVKMLGTDVVPTKRPTGTDYNSAVDSDKGYKGTSLTEITFDSADYYVIHLDVVETE